MIQETLSKSKIQSILWSPVSSIQKATDKEKALFPDKKDGIFYTFELRNGQNFVMHFSSGKMTFRPINHLFPEVDEICLSGSFWISKVKFALGLEKNELKKYLLMIPIPLFKKLEKDELKKFLEIPLPSVTTKVEELYPLSQVFFSGRKRSLSAPNKLKATQAGLEKFITTENKIVHQRTTRKNVPSKDHIRD